MQCDRKAAQGGHGPPTQDRKNQEEGTQKNYLKKDLTPLCHRNKGTHLANPGGPTRKLSYFELCDRISIPRGEATL